MSGAQLLGLALALPVIVAPFLGATVLFCWLGGAGEAFRNGAFVVSGLWGLSTYACGARKVMREEGAKA